MNIIAKLLLSNRFINTNNVYRGINRTITTTKPQSVGGLSLQLKSRSRSIRNSDGLMLSISTSISTPILTSNNNRMYTTINKTQYNR